MAEKKQTATTTTPVSLGDVESFISQLDRLHREKPVGFFAYMTACQSAMAIQNLNLDQVAAKSGK